MSDLELRNLTLNIKQHGQVVNVLDDVSFTFPREHMALTSDKRASTVAVMDLLCRRLVPQRGETIYRGRISWPIGHFGPFSVAVTGTQAISHFSILYGVERDLIVDFMVSEFDSPKKLNSAIYTWPHALQRQFMMLMALVPSFDIYLVDASILLADDPVFTRRFLEMFVARIKDRTALFTVRQSRFLKAICKSGVVIQEGKLTYTQDLDQLLSRGEQFNANPDDLPADDEAMRQQDDEFLL
ncbi:MAG: hypothetical protein RIS94_302 [Pseudomonadota bacterium]|jgi:capsular polysaccharide transport system ATP-binding protein